MACRRQFKDDVRAGRIAAGRLAELVLALQRELQAANEIIDQTKQELDQAKQPIADLGAEFGRLADGEGYAAVFAAGGRTATRRPGERNNADESGGREARG